MLLSCMQWDTPQGLSLRWMLDNQLSPEKPILRPIFSPTKRRALATKNYHGLYMEDRPMHPLVPYEPSPVLLLFDRVRCATV